MTQQGFPSTFDLAMTVVFILSGRIFYSLCFRQSSNSCSYIELASLVPSLFLLYVLFRKLCKFVHNFLLINFVQYVFIPQNQNTTKQLALGEKCAIGLIRKTHRLKIAFVHDILYSREFVTTSLNLSHYFHC